MDLNNNYRSGPVYIIKIHMNNYRSSQSHDMTVIEQTTVNELLPIGLISFTILYVYINWRCTYCVLCRFLGKIPNEAASWKEALHFSAQAACEKDVFDL